MRRAFTLIELIVVIAVVGALLGILLPAMEKVRHKGYIQACGSNLHQIGAALAMYANENHENYPRTNYSAAGVLPVAGTGVLAVDPFGPAGPGANDVTAALWLLARATKLPTAVFICPYDDVNEFQADPHQPSAQSNFTDYRKNLGYSYANPYPDASATTAGYRLSAKVPADFAVMADLNPGVSDVRKADVFRPGIGASDSNVRFGNSENHEREGQNVLYSDGHVSYETSPLVGVAHDNIYTAQQAKRPNLFVSPSGPSDSVLLPVD